MNFLEIWFRSVFSARRRDFPSKWVIQLLFNSAPRKFKKLRNWCFYCVKNLSNLNLVLSRCICNKGVRSRQEYINCFQLLTLVNWKPTDLRSWKVTLKYFYCALKVILNNLRRLNLNKLSQSYFYLENAIHIE